MVLSKAREWGGKKKLVSLKAGSIIIYTVLWSLLALLIFFIFKSNGRSFLYINDGVYQHFSSFQYLCDYLKDLIYNFHFKGFFDFTLGQGMDILTTLNSYDFTDPISVLCACVFPLSRASRYTLMIFIKLYLIGLAFLFYCYATDHHKKLAVISGAIAYVFCGAILFFFARHPNYINWAYFFPFILGGVELYFRKGKKMPLILSVFLNIITSYYTFYMNVLLVAIYVLIHGVCRVIKEKKWSALREEFIRCIKLVGVCSIGILLSAFILFPTIYTYLNNNRIGELTGYTASALHYDSEYYKNLFENLFAPFRDSGYTTYIGFNVILIIPLILIFTKKKQYTDIKCLLFISMLMLCVPLAGRIMNGFGYAINRWSYAIPFYASVILVIMFTEIGNMSTKEKVFVFATIAIYVVLCSLHMQTNNDSLKLATLLMIIIIVFVIGLVLHYRKPYIEPLLLLLVFLGASFQIYFTFAKSEGNYVSHFLEDNKVITSYTDYSSTAAENCANTDEFYRTEMQEDRTNVNGYNHVYGTGFYWSLVSGDMMDYYTNLDIDTVGINCGAGGLDGRTGLLELASVKFYTRPKTDEGLVPYGYQEINSSDERYQVYENEYALPIGYTYSKYISSSDYSKMNGVEKEQALMQGAVLEEAPDNIEKANLEINYEILDYEISNTKNVSLNDNNIVVEDVPGEIDFNVDIPDNYEIYINIKGYQLDDNASLMQVEADRSSGQYSIAKNAQLSNLHYEWAVIRDDVLFNLGCGHAGNNTITLTFKTKATLSYDEIQILAVPMYVYEIHAEKLGEYVLDNVIVGKDQINGIISVPEERILQFSVPYSDGWTVYVDGEEVPTMKSDGMYMAIQVSTGTHSVELRYETPYLRIGIVVTVATAVLYAIYEIIRHKRSKE